MTGGFAIRINMQYSAAEDRMLLACIDEEGGQTLWWLTRALALGVLAHLEATKGSGSGRKPTDRSGRPLVPAALDCADARLLRKVAVRRSREGAMLLQFSAQDGGVAVRLDAAGVSPFSASLRPLCMRCGWMSDAAPATATNAAPVTAVGESGALH